jgi:isopenicillin N synthase-like dioxygenase
MEKKQELAWVTPEANRGYVAPGREKVSRLMDANAIDELRESSPDLKESMEIGKEPSSDFQNNWPESDPSFRTVMMDFYDSCHELHLQVMDSIGLGLGLSQGFFTKFCDSKEHNLRLLHYPEVEKNVLDRPNQTRAGAHSDYGTITLLFQDQIGGLQVKNPIGEFVNAPPIENAIVINAGDLLARWSNDMIASTEHRVVSPPYCPKNQKYPERYSVAYFCNPNFNATIECLDGTWDKDHPKKYPAINSYEYLVQRLSATY